LDVQGGTITDSTGALTISTGAANGNITLTPNGTGIVSVSSKASVGSTANFTDWPNAQFVASQANGGDTHTYNMGVVGEAVADSGDSTRWGVGVYGNGFTNGVTRSAGVLGDGSVTNTADSGSAVGVRGYSTDTHAGGLNIGVIGDASGSSTGNYAFYAAAGDITAAGAVSIATLGSNGSITLAPNGSGSVALTLADGGNLTNTRNYVKGAIRNSTLAAAGEIWAVNSTGPASPFQGISIDNSADTTTGPGTVLRSFSGGAVAGSGTRGRYIFEKARGTSASPTAVQSGDFLGSIDATGYTSTGWINDTLPVVPAFFGFTASENWVSNTNLGTTFALSLAPTATTVSTSANLINTIITNPQSLLLRSDEFGIGQGKTSAFTATGCSTSGTTLTIGTVTSGTVAVGQLIQSSTNSFRPGAYIVANISGSGSGSTWTVSYTVGTQSSLTVAGNTGFIGSPNGGATVDALADLRLLKNAIKNSAGTTCITLSTTAVTSALPIQFPTYTIAGKPATGAGGQQISISDSTGNGGRMAYWDTTNSRWNYVSDDTAV